MNTVFKRWRDEGLVWLPHRGMGYFPVTAAPYDEAYWAKYEQYAATPMGEAITRFRADLVEKYAAGMRVCDVGIGCGSFVEARPGTVGFDINPVGIVWLKNRRLWCDPRDEAVDALCFFDCLEHISRPDEMLANARNYVFVSIPIVPGHGPPPLDWRHLRKDEHCWYFTRSGLINWMREHGFTCLEHSTAESLMGREDSHTFVFLRLDE